MSTKREVKGWFTMNGKHIPIYEDESKQDALNRSIAKDNEDKKQEDIERNKQEADRLNNKTLDFHSSSKDIQSYYKDKYSIDVDNSYFEQGNDKSFLVDTSKRLDKIYSEFPVLKDLNVKIKAKDFKGDDSVPEPFKKATALSESNSPEIWVNSNKFNNYQNLEITYMKRVLEGKYPLGTTVSNILIHELGHKVEYALAKKIGVEDKDLKLNGTSHAIVKYAFNDMPKDMFKNIQEARDSISEYAGKNYPFFEDMVIEAYEETFAEAISDYIANGSKAKPYSKRIVLITKNMLKER